MTQGVPAGDGLDRWARDQWWADHRGQVADPGFSNGWYAAMSAVSALLSRMADADGLLPNQRLALIMANERVNALANRRD